MRWLRRESRSSLHRQAMQASVSTPSSSLQQQRGPHRERAPTAPTTARGTWSPGRTGRWRTGAVRAQASGQSLRACSADVGAHAAAARRTGVTAVELCWKPSGGSFFSCVPQPSSAGWKQASEMKPSMDLTDAQRRRWRVSPHRATGEAAAAHAPGVNKLILDARHHGHRRIALRNVNDLARE